MDAGVILILLRAVRKFGAYQVQEAVLKFLKEKERSSGRDLSFEKQEIHRIIWEL